MQRAEVEEVEGAPSKRVPRAKGLVKAFVQPRSNGKRATERSMLDRNVASDCFVVICGNGSETTRVVLMSHHVIASCRIFWKDLEKKEPALRSKPANQRAGSRSRQENVYVRTCDVLDAIIILLVRVITGSDCYTATSIHPC